MKPNQLPIQIITSGNMSGNLSAIFPIPYQDNIGIELDFTGTPVGTFTVSISNSYQAENGVVQNAGSFIPIPVKDQNGNAPVASGSATQLFLSLNQVPAAYVKIAYTAGSSTGTLNVYLMGKLI